MTERQYDAVGAGNSGQMQQFSPDSRRFAEPASRLAVILVPVAVPVAQEFAKARLEVADPKLRDIMLQQNAAARRIAARLDADYTKRRAKLNAAIAAHPPLPGILGMLQQGPSMGGHGW